MKRTFPLIAVAVGAALLLSACSSTGGPVAAKVGSTTISRTTLNDDLKAMTGNTAVSASLSKSLSVKVKPTNGGVDMKLATLWLTTLVNQAAIDQYFDSHNLKVTAANRAAAKAATYATFVNKKTFRKLPKSFQDSALARQGRIQAVESTLPATAPPSDAELQQTLDSGKASLCPSGQVVAHIQVKTEAEANAIEAQLAAGASFGDLAVKNSADTGSGAVGGLIACTGSDGYNQLPASFRAGSDKLTLGQTSPPVQTEFGWHVIRVEPFDLDTARLLLIRLVQQQQASPITKFIQQQLRKRDVWVDPRYGTVNKTKAALTIVPPVTPNPRSNPADPTATITPAAGATGQ